MVITLFLLLKNWARSVEHLGQF